MIEIIQKTGISVSLNGNKCQLGENTVYLNIEN
jgi:hypothetical protein